MKIGITADWHISASNSIDKINPISGRNQRLDDIYTVCLYLQEVMKNSYNCEVLLHCGDIFNSTRPSPTEQVLASIAFGHTNSYGITGNHELAKGEGYFDANYGVKPWEFSPIVKPEVITLNEKCGPQIAFLPYPNKAILLAKDEYKGMTPAEANSQIRKELVNILNELALQIDPKIPSCLIGHLSLDTATAGQEGRLMMMNGDISLSIHDIPDVFTQVFFGHIHKPQDLTDRIHIPGSPCVLDFGEEGEQKSYIVWDTETNTIERVPIEGRKYITIEGIPDDISLIKDAVVRVRPVLEEGESFDERKIRRELYDKGAFHVVFDYSSRKRAERIDTGEEAGENLSFTEAVEGYIGTKPDMPNQAEVKRLAEKVIMGVTA